MLNNLQIYAIVGVNKSEFNIPKHWTVGSFLTSKGRVFQVNSTSILGPFITEDELKIKIKKYYRKQKLNELKF